MLDQRNNTAYPIMVSIRCLVYNHEPYLRQCLDGFVMQKTSFPFEAIIHDDASTDGSADIIKEYAEKYPDIIKPIYETENLYSKHDGSISRIINDACKGKYMASCEGDDYWTDPNKLQKQVDVLENHPECTIVFNRVKVISKDNKYLDWDIPRKGHVQEGFIELKDYTYEEYNRGFWTFHTSSFLYKSNLMNEFSEIRAHEFKNFPYGDMPFLLFCLIRGKGFFISETMGCYRYLSGGYNSKVKKNPSFSISQEEKLIKALKDLDKFTKMKYHDDIQKKILRSTFKTELLKGNYKMLFNKDLKIFLNNYPMKIRLYFFVRGFMPKLYTFFFKIKYSFYHILKHNKQ